MCTTTCTTRLLSSGVRNQLHCIPVFGVRPANPGFISTPNGSVRLWYLPSHRFRTNASAQLEVTGELTGYKQNLYNGFGSMLLCVHINHQTY